MTRESPRTARAPCEIMILLSFLQGLLLLFLWRAATEQTWPTTVPVAAFPLWTVALVWPTLLLFCLERGNTVRVVVLASAVMALLALLAVYVGWQASPYGAFSVHSLIFVAAVTLAIACNQALMYLPPFAARTPWTYNALYRSSWRNFIVGALGTAMMAGVAIILFIWAMLFGAIGIEFFADLFSEDWFLFPVLSVAFGLGVFIFRSRTHLIDRVADLVEGLIRLLLPLVLAVAVLFLGSLPFTGLAPLWDSGHGTSLLLSLNAIALFFINGVYRTGAHQTYPGIVHRSIALGIVLLPIVSVVALLGLYMRVDQYGWTVERCWGTAVAAVLGMFSAGYAWGVIRRRWHWPQSLARANIVLGWVVAGLVLAANSPLLDFRAISTRSQFARVEAGTLPIREFDFYYASEHLARPAYLRMRALVEELEASDPELAQEIRSPTQSWNAAARASRVFWERVVYRPEPFEVPEELRTMLQVSLPPTSVLDDSNVIALVRVDLDDDIENEYVTITDVNAGYKLGRVFYRDGEQWKIGSLTARETDLQASAVEVDFRFDPIATAPPPFRDLTIGGSTFAVNP